VFNQSLISANKFLDMLLGKVSSLESFSSRGSVPHELLSLGICEFRQILLGSYRIIYSIEETTVYVHIIADSRRDMQTLLEKRLLARSI
jgi:toxin ParE1/3/4